MSRDPVSPPVDALGIDATLTATAAAPAPSSPTALERGAAVGRYVVLGPIGAGAMGAVFAAYDPELDRKVALKILHADRAEGERGSIGRTRLLREAQALAKLDDPNVVTVHDVGTIGDRVWIAMEYVHGETLRAWLRRRSPPWRTGLEVMCAAGRGLAAAHRAGLLHRDFKPDNVMVGADDRVWVMDFGLALREQGPSDGIGVDSKIKPQFAALAVDVTGAGSVIGTPAYMAPEQLLGERADARSDQHAFCVTLWEVLYGERPVSGATLPDLLQALLAGQRRPPNPARRVPAWVRRICERGLALKPSDRFPSLDALLEALERGRRRSRIGRNALVIAGVAGLGLVVLGHRAWRESTRVAACADEGAAIDAVWNDRRRAEIDDAFAATGFEFAATSATNTRTWLDVRATAWREQAQAACLARTSTEPQPAADLDSTSWCLEERRLQIEALVDQLAQGGIGAVRRSVSAATQLGDPARCLDLRGLLASPDAERREAAAELRAEVIRIRALIAADHVDAAREATGLLGDRADLVGWPPLAADVRRLEAWVAQRSGDYAQMERSLVDAHELAATAGAWGTAADVAEELIAVVGHRLARPTEGHGWARHAAIAAAHAGDPLGLREAGRLSQLGVVEYTRAEHGAARAAFERALELRRAALGDEHPDVAGSLSNLASTYEAAGDYAGMRDLLEESVAIRTAVLGADHPDVAAALSNLGGAYRALGDFERASSLMQRALVIREAALGPDHPDVAQALVSFAAVLRSTGDPARARDHDLRALAIRERKLRPDHPDIAISLNNLGNDLVDLGDLAGANDALERALAIAERARGPEHPDLAPILGKLADVRRRTGAPEQARALLERALSIREAALGPAHPKLVPTLAALASLDRARGDRAQARARLERALSVLDAGSDGDPQERVDLLVELAATERPDDPSAAQAALVRAIDVLDTRDVAPRRSARLRFAVAKALAEDGLDLGLARAQARAAASTLAGLDGDDALRREIDAWINAHPE
jgi:tetratricopeptide (TPR) repeat protein